MSMKLNNNGKPRKTFNLAISIAREQQDEAWDDIHYWNESEEKWRDRKDLPKHAEHYKSVLENYQKAWDKWHGVTRVLNALEEIENA